MKSDSLPTLLRLFNPPAEMLIDNEGNDKNYLNLPYKFCAIKGKKLKYLEFWIFDENTNKLHRKRKECPKDKDFSKWFKENSFFVNDCLQSGVRIRKIIKIEVKRTLDSYTIIEAFEYAKEIRKIKLATNSQTRDKSFFNIWLRFLNNQNMQNLTISELEKKHIYLYLDTVKVEQKLNNMSRNKYLDWIKAVLNDLIERGYIEKNVAIGVKPLKEAQTKSVAFEIEHARQLKKILIEENYTLYVFSMCIFYTFVRPIELRRLTIGQVNLKNKQIHIYGNGSKNGKNDFVMIPKLLSDILVESKILERPKNEYIFDGGDLKYSRNSFSVDFSKIIAKHEFPKDYTLYCWKHTGVVQYYKNGCGIKFIQKQCRHASLDETDKYLKDLGLFDNNDILDNAPEL